MGVLLGGAASLVQAQTLSELVQQARGYDATWQAQQADARAAASRADQALSGLLPSVGLSAGANRTHVDVHTSVAVPGMASSFNNTQQNVQVSAQQPLYRPANKIAYEQGQRGVDVAQAQLDASAQNLIVRVSQAYFDVLAAQDSVQVAQAQKQAISTQLEMAKRNFEVGTATITDSREAQSRFDLVTAQEIAAQNDLQVKRVALDQLVGRVGIQPTPLAAPMTLPKVEPDNMQAWVDQALASQPQLRQAQLALDIAKLETRKAEAGHKPTVDLQAGYVVNRYPNGSMTPSIPLSYRTNAAQIGVVMNMPLFAGFAVQNRVKETVALEEKPAPSSMMRAAMWSNPRARPFWACSQVRPRSRHWKPPWPPARVRSKPTKWVTTWACASTSMCSMPRVRSTRPSETWPMPAIRCCWASSNSGRLQVYSATTICAASTA